MGSGAELVPNEEPAIFDMDIRGNKPVAGVDRITNDLFSIHTQCIEIQMRSLGEVQPEVVGIASRAYCPGSGRTEIKTLGRADGAARIGYCLGVQGVVPCRCLIGAIDPYVVDVWREDRP